MPFVPTKETATGMESPPVVGIILSICILLAFFFIVQPYAGNMQTQEKQKLESLKEKVQTAKRRRQIPESLALDLIENPHLIGDTNIFTSLPLEVRVAYRKYVDIRPLTRIDIDFFNWKAVVHGLLNMNYYLFFLTLFFFILASFYIEHIFSALVFLVITLLLTLSISVLCVQNPYTWQIPLNDVFVVVTLSLWGLVLRMAPRTQLFFAVGFLPVKFGYFRSSISTFLLPILFILGLVVEHVMNQTFMDAKIPALVALIAILFLSILPLITGVRLNREENTEWRVLGRGLNEIEREIDSGDMEQARKSIVELNAGDLDYEQNRRLGELAWKAGMRDIVRTAAYRQLLKFEGTEDEKDTLRVSMLTRGMSLPGSNYEVVFKHAVQKSDDHMLRNILPYLKDQREKTQESVKIYLRERIKKAELSGDAVFFSDVKPHLKGLPVFSSLVTKIVKNQRAQQEQSSYVDNYSRSQHIHKLIDVTLKEVHNEYIEMVLPNNTTQKVPWTALKAVYGANIRMRPCGVLLLEFKHKLFACRFSEGTSGGNKFVDAWKNLVKQKPDVIPLVDIVDFEEIKDEDLINKCEEFLGRR